MGSYTINYKGLKDVTVMEKVAETAASGKKRKIGLEEAADLSTSSVQLKTRRLTVMTPVNSASPVNSGHSTCESVSSDNVLASCCSSNGLSELEKITQEEVRLEFFATSTGDSLDCRERREATPLSEVQAESSELESTTRPHESVSRRSLMAEKMPSKDELEEFFAAAEKNLQKKFIDKYNYDIVKDEPLEGRYEWVIGEENIVHKFSPKASWLAK